MDRHLAQRRSSRLLLLASVVLVACTVAAVELPVRFLEPWDPEVLRDPAANDTATTTATATATATNHRALAEQHEEGGAGMAAAAAASSTSSDAAPAAAGATATDPSDPTDPSLWATDSDNNGDDDDDGDEDNDDEDEDDEGEEDDDESVAPSPSSAGSASNSEDPNGLLQQRLKVPARMRALVMLADFSRACGSAGAAMSEQDASDFLFEKPYEPLRPGRRPTLEGMLRSCSHGAARLHAARAKVVTVPMPRCNGSSSLGGGGGNNDSTNTDSPDTGSGGSSPGVFAWSWDRCPQSTAGFSDEVERRVLELGLVPDLPTYDYRWVVLDRSQATADGCYYTGLSTQGCSDVPPDRAAPVCRAVMTSEGAYSTDLYAWLHEVGHNLGLEHSARAAGPGGILSEEQGDGACAMGGYYDLVGGAAGGGVQGHPFYRCFNLAQAARLGWAVPEFAVHVPEILGMWREFTLLPQHVANTTGVQVITDVRVPPLDDAPAGAPPRAVSIYLSYRATPDLANYTDLYYGASSSKNNASASPSSPNNSSAAADTNSNSATNSNTTAAALPAVMPFAADAGIDPSLAPAVHVHLSPDPRGQSVRAHARTSLEAVLAPGTLGVSGAAPTPTMAQGQSGSNGGNDGNREDGESPSTGPSSGPITRWEGGDGGIGGPTVVVRLVRLDRAAAVVALCAKEVDTDCQS